MLGPEGLRRTLAATYLQDRTLEQALAAWRADYDAPTFREGRKRLARLGTAIRRLAAEAENAEKAPPA